MHRDEIGTTMNQHEVLAITGLPELTGRKQN